ncbi:MAG: TetR/AcrR family transcriptional regulator [FCB group bacterium]|nr:TetR/AcrR family transcriptional regulator [FCB group bacterium]
MTITDRQQREKAFRKQTILEAAKRLFAQKGYQETSMNDIAAEAELGKATLYYYFNSKDAIYREIYLSFSRTYYEAITREIQTTATVESLVDSILQGHVKQGEMDRDFLSLLYPIGRNAPIFIFREPEVLAETAALREPIRIHIESVFTQAGIQASPDIFQQVLWSFMTGLAVKIIRGHSHDTLAAEIEFFKTSILNHLRKEN